MKNGTLIIAVLMILGVSGCSSNKELEEMKKEKIALEEKIRDLEGQVAHYKKSDAKLKFLAAKMQGVKARMITNFGTIEMKFYPDDAPIQCFNFITRAESGFYDGTQFHRVIPGFMIQGGDPNTKDNNPYNDGQGGPIVNVPHEFNKRSHKRGVLSTARVSDPSQGAGSQFFIMHAQAPHLDGQYTVFGEVTKGMEVVDEIARVKKVTNDPRLRDRPAKPVIIEKIEVFR